MGLPSDDLIGFATEVKMFLDANKAALIAKSYDPTADIARLGTDCETFSEEDREHEAMKTALKEKTDDMETLASALYDDASSTLDAAIGKLGKTTEKGKEGARIRSKLRARRPNTEPPPSPAP